MDLINHDFAIVVTYKTLYSDSLESYGYYNIIKGNQSWTINGYAGSGWSVGAYAASVWGSARNYDHFITVATSGGGGVEVLGNSADLWTTSVNQAWNLGTPIPPGAVYQYQMDLLRDYVPYRTKIDGGPIYGEPIPSDDDLFIYGSNVIIDEIRIYDRYLTYNEVNQLIAGNGAVPLPSTVWLLGSGLLGLAGWRRFRRA
jgi:hypothetical protein